MMLSKLKEMILDFQEMPLQTGIPRRVEVVSVPRKVTVCMGVRRSGKSTFLFQLMERLVQSGVSRRNILYLNFFDDRLHALQQDGLGEVMEAYFSLFPEKKDVETVYCFFDEIQMIPRWESFLDRLMRTEKCEIYVTGSSAQMLSREIATQMRGRSLAWEIFPFSFQEFLDYKEIKSTGTLSTKRRLLIQKAFDEYCETGGFPEVAGLGRTLRVKIHQEYFHAMLFRDLIERHDVPHPRSVVDLAQWLINHTASSYSINSLTGYLKSLGHKVSKAAVSDYLAWFEDAYLFFTVRVFDASLARANTNPKKIFCIDPALATSISSGILVNSGHLLENLIFIALRRWTQDIFYFKSKTGREVDFVVQRADRSRMLVQVCESLVNPATRNREVEALTHAMMELQETVGMIITRNEEEQIAVDGGKIEVIPAWRFLLQNSLYNP